MQDTSLNEHLTVPLGKVLIYTHMVGDVVEQVVRKAGETLTREEIDGGELQDAFHPGLLDTARSRMSKD